ncbi:MAG: SCO family protein [Acidobacteriaceae bacterium]
MRPRLSVALLLVAMAGITLDTVGCHSRTSTPSVAGATQRYAVRGVVMSTDPSNGAILLKHDEIPGFMPAMTMAYRLEDPSMVSRLHPGDLITATLLVDHDSSGPTNLRLTRIEIIAQARPNSRPKVNFHAPAKGDAVPDFSLLNQSGHKIGLRQFRGKVVLLTFIYTRCPLPDYCPRLMSNFAAIDKSLKSDPALYQKTHLLSISFDPAYDTPGVLRRYGEAYMGDPSHGSFAHWEFAAPAAAELPSMEEFFDVGVTPQANGILQHSLSTVVIDPQGRVFAFYPTNNWSVAEVLAQIRSAAF